MDCMTTRSKYFSTAMGKRKDAECMCCISFRMHALYSAQIHSWDILQEKEQKRVTIIHILFIFFNPTSFLVGMKELKKPKHASN